jgi:apolipoprotein N-acyltransferase
VLTLPAAGGGQGLRFGAAICYEDTVPGEYRKFVVDSDGAKRVDFMVTLSNGGWFGHGAQQAQHFASCVLRAVENRVWIARATNTGVSGFINPDGTWHDLVGPSDRSPQSGGMGHRTARAVVDPRVTFYSRHGDVLAWGCLVIAAVALLDAAIAARRRKG